MNLLLIALMKGIAFGITMAAIPGPIFFLIIQRTLHEGVLIGLLCGLGAMTADAVYAGIAAIGLTIVSHYLLTYQSIITLIGGIFLVYLGITTFTKNIHSAKETVVAQKGMFNAWFSTFLLTLTNPVTIISYTVIFAGLGIGPDTMLYSALLVIGVIIGALMVVIALLGLLSVFRQKLSLQALAIINKTAGILLIGFGIAAIMRGLMMS